MSNSPPAEAQILPRYSDFTLSGCFYCIAELPEEKGNTEMRS
jgi:hypothetical protein